MQYEILRDLFKNLQFKNNKYDMAKRKMLQELISKFKDKKKRFLFLKRLINVYKLPIPFALGLSYVYQYIKRLQYKGETNL
jgi:membrane protein DedA with SNARE-associated domain